MHLPVRKCYHAVKISIFLVIVVTLLTCFERWRGGRRTARAQFLSPEEEEYERQILEDEARIIPGLGEGGVAAHLVGEAKRLGEESEKKLAINVYLSDRIAYNRTLKDHRNPACERVLYDAELPSASVILIFHNEPYSVVVRTIWSVINSARRDQPWYSRANFVDRETGRTMTLGYPGQDPSSPFVYLKEIILVDDNSTLAELKGKLSHYIRTRLPPDLVRVVRLPDRVGLTQARLAGARFAVGDVLVFLDSHCEGQPDWLRPLLQRVKEAPHAVVVPIIDVIEASNFYYSVQDPTTFQVGGFTFTGHFTWVDVPEREKKRRGSDIAPTWSPTMAGGLFAMERAYFWQLGAYDEQMAGWGGENLEMSFRVWQCGGTLETIPCSRVGHVFRSFHPYGLPAHTDTHGINTARMAEVWMDDYAELFYLHRPDLRKSDRIGDVTHRRMLRAKLQCRSFQWYLRTVYPEKFVPVRDVYGYGRFKNPSSGLCLDTMQREGEGASLGGYPCHARLAAAQYLALSAAAELRDEERCAELQYTRSASVEEGRRVLMVTCHGKQRGQKWRYLPSKQLKHVESGLCLEAPREAAADVKATPCRGEASQRWDIDYSEDNNFGLDNNVEPSEQELRLQRLRGRRRISRSLLSSESRRGHHKHRAVHKTRRKNKFVLKLLRDRNDTQEHLEAEVYCRHRRLLPNDSFVRDIVTVLNDRGIKVINNGRLFEKNKVTELAKKHDTVKAVKVLEKMELPPRPTLQKTPDVVRHTQHYKHKVPSELVQPYDPQVPINSMAVQPVNAAYEAASVASVARDKHIIIEDFVAVTPVGGATVTPKVSKLRRKRKRNRTPAPIVRATHAARSTPHKQWEEPNGQAQVQSVEDSPLLGSGELRKRSHSDHDPWTSDSRDSYKQAPERVAPVYTRDERDNSLDTDSYTTQYPVPKASVPVKLVMRSNLTFQLGDELFDWQRAAGDVANLLGELSIPVSTSPPRTLHSQREGQKTEQAELKSETEDAQESAEEAVLTGRGILSGENAAAKDTESSGSSESGSSDS